MILYPIGKKEMVKMRKVLYDPVQSSTMEAAKILSPSYLQRNFSILVDIQLFERRHDSFRFDSSAFLESFCNEINTIDVP